MSLTMAEKIRIILRRRGVTLAQLAAKTGQSRQNLANKLARDNFNEKDLQAIARALNCAYEARFVMRDTGVEV